MKYVSYFIGFIFLTGCAGNESNSQDHSEKTEKLITVPPLDTMKWLIGSWENKNENGVMTETWSQQDDSALTGIVTASYLFKDESMDEPRLRTDTLETIRIEQLWGKLSYIPAVKDQNNGMPVKFKMTFCNAERFVFENPDHDFPQKITYERIGADSLVATVSGKWEGQEVKETFPMKRTN
jgi:hypothetical protein